MVAFSAADGSIRLSKSSQSSDRRPERGQEADGGDGGGAAVCGLRSLQAVGVRTEAEGFEAELLTRTIGLSLLAQWADSVLEPAKKEAHHIHRF